MEYQVKNHSELERYAQEMGLSLEETAHQIALDRYIERGYSIAYAEQIIGKEPNQWYFIFDVCMDDDRHIQQYGETKPINLF